MIHRAIGDDDGKQRLKDVAERIRAVLMRAAVLMVVLMAVPYIYAALTGGRLDHLVGGDATTWETIEWALLWGTVFLILGTVGVARCTRGTG